jgi:endonuclease YncB( thermonuclease family)
MEPDPIKRRFIIELAGVLAIFCIGWFELAHGVSSYALVQDDASMRIDGRTYRLHGIYVPPTDQSCREFERPMRCSTRAALALEFKIGVNFVRCEPRAKNDDGTISAYCTVNGEDLAAYLLERGWALALPDAPFEYQALEKIARSRGLGVWGFPVERRPAR